MKQQEIVLEAEQLSKSFIGVQALKDFDFSLHKGEVHVLVGENGAGKSTFLKIISGLHSADEGQVKLDGKVVKFKNPQDSQNSGIAMVYQELTLLPEMTVAQNIFLNNQFKDRLGFLDVKAAKKKCLELSKKYGIELEPDALVRELPIEIQQQVEIVKALSREPNIIAFDEPTSSLGKEAVEKLFEIIRNLKAMGHSIIFISHRIDELFKIGDRATVLKDGLKVGTAKIEDLEFDDLISMMVGRSLEQIYPPKCNVENKEVVFRAESISLHGRLHDISFDCSRGEIISLAGLQGHGQTELLNCLSGIEKMHAGKVILNDKEVNLKSVSKAIDSKIVLVPQDRKVQGLMLTHSIRNNLALASNKLRSKFGFLNFKKEKEFAQESANSLSVKMTGLNQQVVLLSGGNQQKVVIGKCMAIKPKVMLFNEPTRGVDVETKQEFYRMMREYANEGVIVIFYSSDMLEVIGLSDKVLVMCEGVLKAELTGNDITEELIMKHAVGM